MIPKKNLFSGALGKLKEIGGSRCFSTPHTVDVPVQYQVNSNLVGDFVTCSFDGRLICLKRSNRYTFFSLKWNPVSNKLEFAASLTRINENILARGLDWILTAKVFIKVLDDSPYILVLNLFNDSSTLSMQNEQSVAHCYSILPHICDFKLVDDVPALINEFQIIENFLVRRDNNGNMLSRLIPVEFFQTRVLMNNNLFNDELSLSCSDYHIIAHNSMLWGAGKYALGKVFLLPAVFDSTGKANTFYLYFQYEHKLPRSPQFLRILIDDLDNSPVITFEGHSFALIKKYKSWEDAKNDCIARGGHLATATSIQKNDFLVSLAGNSYQVWLGAIREYSHDNWTWVNGEEWKYENWNDRIITSYDYPYSSARYLVLVSQFNGWLFDCAHVYYSTESSEFNIVEFNVKTAYYICEWDSLDVYDTWLNHMNDEPDNYSLAPAFLNDNLLGYKFNSGHNLCSLSDDNFILNPVSGEWTAVSEHNGNIHFDINQSKAILIDDYGATFLYDDNTRFDCRTLNQWLAPAHSVDALDDNLVVSSADNLSVVTHPDSGFMREALHNKLLPLSSPSGNGCRFSLGYSTNSSNRKIVDVNQIASSADVTQPVLWNNIYRHALDLELVNIVRDVHFAGEANICSVNDFSAFLGSSDDFVKGMKNPFFCKDCIFYRLLTPSSNYRDSVVKFGSARVNHSRENHPRADVVTEASVDVYYIDPANGNVCLWDNIHASFDDYEFYSWYDTVYIKKATYTDCVSIVQGKIGFVCTTYYLTEPYVAQHVQCTESFFLPVKDIPDNLLLWSIPNRMGEHYSSGRQGIVLDRISDSYARFHETSTNLIFALSCNNIPDIENETTSFASAEPYINIDNNRKKFTHSIHIAGVFKSEHQVWVDNKGRVVVEIVYDTEGNITRSVDEVDWNVASSYNIFSVFDLYIFRSRLHNDVFNFDSELKRSGLS